MSGQDDRSSIWVDLDQDGLFEAVGDKGNEQLLNASQSGYAMVDMEPGLYRVAFAHREGSGGSRMNVGIRLPGGNRMNVQPGHRDQHGLWVGTSEKTIDTSSPASTP